MLWITHNPIAALSYFFLYITVLLLWEPERKLIASWILTFIIAIILGLASHQLELISLIPIIALTWSVHNTQTKNRSTKFIALFLTFIIALGLFAHRFPGFHNLKVLDHEFISRDGIPFTLYLNFDTSIVGILILGLSYRRITKKSEWKALLKRLVIQAPIAISSVIIAAFALGYIHTDFKVEPSLGIWLITNLLFVCVAEEAFYRGFIQKNLALSMKKLKYGNYLAIVIAAILFGISHYAGGIKYVELATVAGLGYGWIFFTTQRIEGSILTHFGLNVVHILFFTYPALVSVVHQ